MVNFVMWVLPKLKKKSYSRSYADTQEHQMFPKTLMLDAVHVLEKSSFGGSMVKQLEYRQPQVKPQINYLRHELGWISKPLDAGLLINKTGIRVSTSFSSVAQSCLTLCDPMNCSIPGLPVHHQLLESTQTHVHWVGDAIQPSHPLPSPSPPALNLSQHQGLFQWVSSSHQVAKVLEFQLQHQSFQWTPRTDLL